MGSASLQALGDAVLGDEELAPLAREERARCATALRDALPAAACRELSLCELSFAATAFTASSAELLRGGDEHWAHKGTAPQTAAELAGELLDTRGIR
eukprot:gene13703-54853_t